MFTILFPSHLGTHFLNKSTSLMISTESFKKESVQKNNSPAMQSQFKREQQDKQAGPLWFPNRSVLWFDWSPSAVTVFASALELFIRKGIVRAS